MPWRNGGGTTTELVVDPGERFRFRASIADVRQSGPFSRFEGYDRHIMIVEGQGMTLDCGAHGELELAPFRSRLFSGDWDAHGRLDAGPVRDFNWIVDRARARSSLEVRLLDARTPVRVPSGSTCVIHVFAGALREASAGETLVATDDVELTPTVKTRVAFAWAVVLLGALLGCGDRPPPSTPSPANAVARPEASSDERAAESSAPPGVFDVPGGGCSVGERDSPRVCASARELPLTLSFVPTKLHGLAPLAGGQVHNRSSREVYAIGSIPGGWEIARVPPGASLGGELAGDVRHTTIDVDWVSAIPPTPEGSGAFRYEPSTLGVKITDGGTLEVIDRPGGGVRFDLGAAEVTTAGRMNGGSVIVFSPRASAK